MVVTQRNPPQANTRKSKSPTGRARQTSNKKSHEPKHIAVNHEINSSISTKSSHVASPSLPATYQPQQTHSLSPIRPNLHVASTPSVNMSQPLYYTPPVHYNRNFSIPTIYPITAPPTSPPTHSSLAKPIPFSLKEEQILLAPAKLTKQSTPSLPISIPTTKHWAGVYSVDELEQSNTATTKSKKLENFELGNSPGTSPPLGSSAPKKLQNAVVRPANTRYYSDGNYANAPHPSDLPRPQFIGAPSIVATRS